MLGVQEIKRDKVRLNDKFTTCWTERPGDHPSREGVGSGPCTADKQAMKSGNRGWK